jgi:hypothetical protein
MPAAAQHKWKVQNLYGPNTTVYKDFQVFAARVKEATNGAVDIQPFPVATIVPQAEALDAIKAGLLDGAVGTMAYQGGRAGGGIPGIDRRLRQPAASDVVPARRRERGHEQDRRQVECSVPGTGHPGPGVDPVEEADPLDRRFQGREDARARRHPGRDLRQARRVGVRHARHGVYTALDTGKIEATDGARCR